MRSILAGVFACLLFFALAGAASAHDDVTTGTGNLQDPDLAALKQVVDEFRTQLAALADACMLSRATADEATAQSCMEQYAALRAEFKKLKQAAVVIARNSHEWAKRAKNEGEQLKKETEKVDAAKHDEDSLKSKGLQDKITWVEDRVLQDKADLDAAKQHAKEARDAAAGLTGDALDEANEVAAKWDEKAEQYAADIARLTKMHDQLVAALNSPKACARHDSTSCVKKDPKACAATDSNSCATTRERLQQELKSLDEMIAFKKDKIADLKDLLAYKLAQADATTGDERVRWLDLADGVRQEIDQWTSHLNDLLTQRAELVSKLNGAPTTSARDQLTRQLRSLDDLAAYKRQKIADAVSANDQAAVDEWTARLNDVLAQRAEVIAKLNALPQ